MKKLLIIASLFVALCNITTAQVWDYDHSKSTILYGGSSPAPTSPPYAMGQLDQLKLYIGINSPQLGDMCGVNYFAASMCINGTNSGCASPIGYASIAINIINSDTFEIVISATGTGGPFLNVSPDTYFGCSVPMGFPALSNKKIDIVSGSLPIELRSQSLIQIENTQNLQYSWLVATQLNNDFFTPELSLDGVNWKELEKVAGAGTTTEEMAYEVLIKNVSSGYVYVRLKQTDFDGTFAYSPTLSILVKEQGDKAELVITCANDGSNANIIAQNWHNAEAEKFSVEVYDTRGTKVIECLNIPKESFDNLYQIQLPEAAGMYAIRILGSSGSEAYIGRAVKW